MSDAVSTATQTVTAGLSPGAAAVRPDAAALLSVSPRGLWRMIGTGRFGPAVLSFGRLTRIRRSELTPGWTRRAAARRWTWKGS